MKEIRIGPGAQVVILLAVLTALAALVAAMLPELRRYRKIRAM